MDNLKLKYNELLARFRKGQEYYNNNDLSEEEKTKTEKLLNEIQGNMDKILVELKDNYTIEEAQNGFKVALPKTKKTTNANNQNNENSLVVSYTVDDQEIVLTPKTVQEYITGANAGKITNQEFMMFASLCKARKLNPFLKEAYCIKYSNNQPATIVVGKDALVKRAALNPQYNGMKSGIIVIDEKGEMIERKGTFKLPTDKLVGGWAEVFRKDWENSIFCSVSLEECIQKTKEGKPNSNWSKQPATMIEKCAKVRALREAFVEDLGGMYDADEIVIDEPKEVVEIEDVL